MSARVVMDWSAIAKMRGEASNAMVKGACLRVEREGKLLMKTGGGVKHAPSSPGQPPHTQSGEMRSSLRSAVTPATQSRGAAGVVGFTAKYAKMHEHGTTGAGGTLPDIVPHKAKWLTIPATPIAYRRPARFFGDKLRFVPFRAGLAALVLTIRSARRTVRAGGQSKTFKLFRGEVMYWLVKRVALPPRPTLRPALQRVKSTFRAWARGIMR